MSALRRVALLALALALPGCSVAALVQNDNLDKRLQALETRVHTLEVRPSPP